MKCIALSTAVIALVGISPASAGGPAIPTPTPEVAAPISVRLPSVPRMRAPAPRRGIHSVRGLRLRPKLLGEQVRVRGTITWVYDCVEANMKPGSDPKKVRAAVAASPHLCSRPYVHLGDRRSDRQFIWVVEVPRNAVLKVGKRVVISGTWATRSPRGFSNSDGLLVFESVR